MILHQVEALAAAGVTDIVLAVNYRPEIMEKYLAEVGIVIGDISYTYGFQGRIF
jgi:NDP-sugar pyrophosphorylase family protein